MTKLENTSYMHNDDKKETLYTSSFSSKKNFKHTAAEKVWWRSDIYHNVPLTYLYFPMCRQPNLHNDVQLSHNLQVQSSKLTTTSCIS